MEKINELLDNGTITVDDIIEWVNSTPNLEITDNWDE